jgi:hypothetical protein
MCGERALKPEGTNATFPVVNIPLFTAYFRSVLNAQTCLAG